MFSLYVTSMQISHLRENTMYVPAGGGGLQAIGGGNALNSTVTLEMEMDLSPGADAILQAITRNKGRLDFGVERKEWRCIWCAVPNPIEGRFCSQCGGPRGWVL